MRSTNLYTAICVNLHLLSSVSHAFTTTTTTCRIPSSSSRWTAGGSVVVGSTVVDTPSSPSFETTSSEQNSASASSASASASASVSASASSPPPNWESKQHLYGVDMQKSEMSNNGGGALSITLDADGGVVGGGGGAAALPLPQTYVTCGKCNSLFAISEEDLGRGKGW